MEKDLRIKGIKVKNFKAIDTIKVEFDGGHTRIIGLNGHGKTSIIDAIRACFVGVSQKSSKGELLGERFRFIGSKGAAADLEVQLEDTQGNFVCTVSNHMTSGGNGINIITADNRTLSKEWARDLFNVIFRSADNFLKLSPKEQALALGIDTSGFDKQVLQRKEIAKLVRRDIKVLGEPEDLPEVERVDVNALYEKRDAIRKHNSEQADKERRIKEQNEVISNHKTRIAEIEVEIEKLKKNIKERESYAADIKPEPLANDSEILSRISTADETNRSAEAYEANERKRKEKDKLENELGATQAEIGKELDQRTEYIKAFDFAVDGLSVDDEGGLLLNGRRLDTYSTAERAVIVNNLNKSLDPQFKTALIDDFQNLDAANQKKIVDELVNNGIQVITFEVGDKKKGKGSILLRDCAVVGGDSAGLDKGEEKPKII